MTVKSCVKLSLHDKMNEIVSHLGGISSQSLVRSSKMTASSLVILCMMLVMLSGELKYY